MPSDAVEFGGELFIVADKIGLMPLMRFAKVAKAGVDSADLDGLAAMYDLLEQCIAPEEWARFEAHADKIRADGEELMRVVGKVFEILTDRPTVRPSDSSDGPTTTGPRFTSTSVERVSSRLEDSGRPDLALFVNRAAEAQTA